MAFDAVQCKTCDWVGHVSKALGVKVTPTDICPNHGGGGMVAFAEIGDDFKEIRKYVIGEET
jgi:hypothetical protein